MARKYHYAVICNGGSPMDFSLHADKEAAILHFKEEIEVAFEDICDTYEIEGVSMSDLSDNYYPDDDFREAVEAYENWDFREEHERMAYEPQIGWSWTYDCADYSDESHAYGVHFALYFRDEPYDRFHRRNLISLICTPVFEDDEERKKYWGIWGHNPGEYREDEVLKEQFVGENGGRWNPFSNC